MTAADKAKLTKIARKLLEAHLEAAHCAGVAHSRRQRDGSIRVYLFRYLETWGRASEVRWDPRHPFTVEFYQTEPKPGSMTQLDEILTGRAELPENVMTALVDTI